MVTGSKTDMRTNLNEGQSHVDGNIGDNSLHDELQAMLREQRNRGIVDRRRDLNIFRSGSAPPTVEGSLSAVGSLFRNSDFNETNRRSSNNETNGVLTEDEIRLHPAYLSYYYSHENINPRLPPPMLSKEDWRIAQRFQAGISLGGTGDWERKRALVDSDSSSLFSRQPGHSVHKVESGLMELKKAAGRNIPRQTSSDWLERGSDGLIGLSGAGLGPRTKSFADILQEGLDRPSSLPIPLTRPMSRNDFGDVVDGTVISDCHLGELCNGVESIKSLHSRASAPGNVRVQTPGAAVSHCFPSAAGSSLSRSTTPEHQLVARPPVSGLPPVSNRVYPVEKNIGMNVQNGRSSSMTEFSDIAATLSSLSFSRNRCVDEDSCFQSQLHAEFDNQSDFLLNMANVNNQSVQQQITEKSKAEKLFTSTNYLDLARKNGIMADLDGQINFPKRTFSSATLYSNVNSAGLPSLEGSSYQNASIPSLDFIGHVPSGYPVNQKLNAVINNHEDSGLALSGSGDRQSLNRSGNRVGSDLHSYMEPHGVHMQAASDYAIRTSASLCDPSSARNYISTSHGDLSGFQKAYLENLLAQQKQQYKLPLLGKSGGLNQGYYGNSSYGLGMAYPRNPMENSAFPSAGSGNPMFKNDQISCFTSMMRSSMGGPITSWHSDTSNMEGRFASSVLEEFKNKTRSFELSDVVDHVIEFSTDQYGSRFIQQKLETATLEEKDKIFPEILPHSRILMTDVFGNYVIQKFFEHGTESQRKALASELTGHVLPLSLQMYGCRVIQKALEVVDVDQQTQMVAELDGSVMKCVRDQNGNHVIQKCIECVPQDQIQFIISPFYGQVVALSTHPYGCRVIQRVLEHCKDSNTQQIIMGEIMQSVCILAHDQYGNYVIQHVLQYGKLHERSAIISKLAGQIVKMSQQKYASNVVEKCLTFGSPEERQLLVNEILGSVDENEPLQMMMKDPFGNYVVQKLIETCDDQTRGLIVSRIKVHFNTLKRFTYGKHIVTRVEKLIATGERRMGLSSSSPS